MLTIQPRDKARLEDCSLRISTHRKGTKLLKNIQKGDLIDFSLKNEKGDVRIDKITRTGVAEPEDNGSPFGQTIQGVLHGTGELVRSVTSPLPLANEVGNAVGDTTAATGDALRDVPSESKTKF